MTEIMTVNANSREITGEVNYTESCVFDLSEGEKILCVTARSSCNNAEALNDEFRLSIKTAFRAVILAGEEYEVKEVTTESVKSVVKSGVTPTSRGVFCATVTDCGYDNGKAAANVKITGWFLKETVLSFLNSECDSVHCRTTQKTVSNVPYIKESGLNLTQSDECRMPIKKLLDCTPSLIVNNVYPSDGSFRIEGELCIRVAAVTDNNQFLTQSFSHTITTEVEDETCHADSFVDVEGKVTALDVTLTEGDARIIISDSKITFYSTVAENKDITAVTDCYSTDNEIKAEYSTAELDKEFCIRAVRDKCSTSFAPGGEIGEVYCALYPTVSAETVKDNDVIKIDGTIKATVLYSDENNAPSAKIAEIPFSVEIGKEKDCDLLAPEISVSSVSCRIKTGRDIEVGADIVVTARGSKKEELKLISSIEIGDRKTEDDYAISLYIVKSNEDLFDVAKALNTDEDTLLKLNPELKLPLSGGEKVLVYKELMFDM